MPTATQPGASAAIQAHVPLKPIWFQIMLSIATGDQHGYAIRKSVETRTDGKMRLWPTTLYGTLRQIEDADLIEELTAESNDARGARSFRLTDTGRSVLDAESRRLQSLVELARSSAALADR